MVTQPERAAPAPESDSRVRRQAEPGGADYIAVENTLTAEHGNVTVAGPLPPPLSQPSATLAVVKGTAEGTDTAREADPLAVGVTPPEGATLASECSRGRRGQTGPGGPVSAAMRSSPASSFLLCSLFGDALGLPKSAYIALPRRREWRVAAGQYRESFAAYGIRPQNTVIRLPNRTIYILPHVQEFLAGLHSTWVVCLPRWTLGVRDA